MDYDFARKSQESILATEGSAEGQTGDDAIARPFYVGCMHSWLDFSEQTATPWYGKLKFCDYLEKVDFTTLSAAREHVDKLNETQCCPACGTMPST